MSLLVSIASTFLAVLGAMTLIESISTKIDRPRLYLKLSQAKRSLIALIASVILGGAIGILSWTQSQRTKHVLYRLLDLDVKAVQLEGLVNTALAARSTTMSTDSHDLLVPYLLKYGEQITAILSDIPSRVVAPETKGVILERLDNFSMELKQGELKEGLNSRSVDTLAGMIEVIGEVRIIVRRSIYDESQAK